MSNPFVPITTADLHWHGDLPYSKTYEDIYYSIENGLKQSQHVFIDGNDLIRRWSALPSEDAHFNIGETGFGTGLNFLLTWKLWEKHAPSSASLHFISCEKHPLRLIDLQRSLTNWPELKPYAKQLIEHYPILTPGYHTIFFNRCDEQIDENFCNTADVFPADECLIAPKKKVQGQVQLTLMLGDAHACFEQLLHCGDVQLEQQLRHTWVDAWYLDGFAPKKNECMWSESLFRTIAMLSRQGTTLATYTAASVVKKGLTSSGFQLVKSKGYGPKRHRICGQLSGHPSDFYKTRYTPWHKAKQNSSLTKSAIILGAGLAGCFLANALAQRNWQVTLVDELTDVAKGASANEQAILFPKLSAYRSPLTQFMLMAFLFAYRKYQKILAQFPLGELNGSLLLAHHEKERKTQQSLAQWLSIYPELGQLVSAEQASLLSGVSIEHPGLFIPQSGWINSPALCRVLINSPRVELISGVSIDYLHYSQNCWWVNDRPTSTLILANGAKINSFKETQTIPIKALHGQMTQIKASQGSERLKIPLCAEGHILPSQEGRHFLGATYEAAINSSNTVEENNTINRAKLKKMIPHVEWSDTVLSYWAGIRASTPDYLPLVGPVAEADAFLSFYSALSSNAKRWIGQAGPYYPGLYALAGFGSRGLTTIPLCAEWLAASLNGEMDCLPRNLLQALSPARFLHRHIIRQG